MMGSTILSLPLQQEFLGFRRAKLRTFSNLSRVSSSFRSVSHVEHGKLLVEVFETFRSRLLKRFDGLGVRRSEVGDGEGADATSDVFQERRVDNLSVDKVAQLFERRSRKLVDAHLNV